ncbi:Peptidase M15A, C-terminal [uncultured Caudovirales phage]|uniref:Peptidase M15A, C-terminal n=1 Tax=uncultured Caudovirales phage TaxID=2100421 RepID=A0A6J5TBS1_9CAUD|nr:Peptidase M15A, C-terminal [uncultured Caudovirales phage]
MNPSDKLSFHFTLADMIASDTAIRHGWSNYPDPQSIENLKRTCALLEQVRMLFLSPLTVTSGYRSLRVNEAVGSKDSSQHRIGCAVDFRVAGHTPDEVCRTILKSSIKFDQLIREFNSWTHISVPNFPEGQCRGQALIIDSTGTRQFILR